ncbi:MAG: sulfotransferase family protein, partial [Gammaproteobacteria bacterium]|nr:sulfotransferase family protein [Gammaproteobacteria bacterium]
MGAANQLFWKWTFRAVDKVKNRVKVSPHLRSIPFLYCTYLLEIPKAIAVSELRLIYVPVAKVANRSIKAAIAERAGLPYRNHPNEAAWNYIPLATVADSNDYFRFSIVRNPLDRLLSCYTQKILVYRKLPHLRWEFWRYGNRF